MSYQGSVWKYAKRTIISDIQTDPNKIWAMRRELLYPSYTTRLRDIPIAKLS
ncbi:DUF4113 domain-containing protein [Serratia proteamaculans]|uniref:DUF4113 domain-containing protein n=1 Tax=Serratia TaxID=613 RepID=UPI001021A237